MGFIAKTAEVDDLSVISGRALINENASVVSSKISENAVISGSAVIERSDIRGAAKVSGSAWVVDSEIIDDAIIEGKVIITGCVIYDEAHIYDEALLYHITVEGASVFGNAKLRNNMNRSQTEIVIYDSCKFGGDANFNGLHNLRDFVNKYGEDKAKGADGGKYIHLSNIWDMG